MLLAYKGLQTAFGRNVFIPSWVFLVLRSVPVLDAAPAPAAPTDGIFSLLLLHEKMDTSSNHPSLLALSELDSRICFQLMVAA